MKRHIEDALAQCGRDRVMQREGGNGISVAIRYDLPSGAASPDGVERFLVRSGTTLDEAGRAAASAFAVHLRSRARETIEWADRIDHALARGLDAATTEKTDGPSRRNHRIAVFETIGGALAALRWLDHIWYDDDIRDALTKVQTTLSVAQLKIKARIDHPIQEGSTV